VSENQLPNSVGRLDDVVEAIKEGNAEKAEHLLRAERDRREANVKRLSEELGRERRIAIDVTGVWAVADGIRLGLGDTEKWDRLRRACGWEGGDN